MHCRHPFFLLILILTIGLIFGLTFGGLDAQSYEEKNFIRYTRMQGLSNNYISGIAQDSMGYIWIGTNKGLNRFDGRTFTGYYTGSPELSLPANEIRQLTFDGRELIGTTLGGSFVFDVGRRRYRRLLVPSDSSIYFWANKVIQTLRDDKGDYLLSTKTGLFVFDSGCRIINRYDHHLRGDVGRVEMWYGGALIPLNDGRVVQQNNSSFSSYDPVHNRIDTAYYARSPAFKRAITGPDGQQRQAFPGRRDELFIVDPERNELDLFRFGADSLTRMALPFNAAAELDADRSQLIFIGDSLLALTGKVSGFYLLEIHAAAHRLTLIGKKNFEGEFCTALFKDREGRLWVGTDAGLYKGGLSNPFFRSDDLAARQPGLKNYMIRALWSDHDHILVGLRNKGGILVLNKQTLQQERHISLRPGKDSGARDSTCNNISQIYPYDRDTLWIGTRAGLYWLSLHDWRTGRVQMPPDLRWFYSCNTMNMLDDGMGNLWISAGRLNTVIRYHRATREFTGISDRQNPLFRITYCFSMAADRQGNIWLAGDGLCRWNRVRQTIDTLIPYPRMAKRLNNYMLILGRDGHNNLWLYSFGNGILQLDGNNLRMVLRKGDNYLTGGDVAAVSPIIDDHIWLSNDNGISTFDLHDYSSRLFTYSDGFPAVDITTQRGGAWYDAGERTMYLGSGHMLIRFKPDTLMSVEDPPALVIEDVVTAEGVIAGNPQKLELDHSDNYAELNFNAVNFRNPDDNRYAYRILPSSDSSWQQLNWQHSVHFSNLAPGEYHIRVKLFSASGRWPDQEKELSLVVLPPVWKRTWFILAAILVVALLLMGIYRARVRMLADRLSLDKQVAQYEMKALHAQMNPHFIFNALNSIREMILHNDNRNASRYLIRFAQLVRLNLEHSRQTFITLRQNIEYLESYLEMEQLRFADFSYHIQTAPGIASDELRLAPMLIQPLVENAIWHGLLPKQKDKWVRIRFYLEAEMLICEIEDNGIGIRQSMENKQHSQSTHQSVGIGNIRQRIAVLNEKYGMHCSLDIENRADIPGQTESGTLIRMSVPAHE